MLDTVEWLERHEDAQVTWLPVDGDGVVDLGGDEPPTGTRAVLFGPGDGGEPTAEDWAQAAGTIAYEIVTRIGTRVPRVPGNEGQPG